MQQEADEFDGSQSQSFVLVVKTVEEGVDLVRVETLVNGVLVGGVLKEEAG